MSGVVRGSRFRRDVRDLEEEEEMWFNNDEEDLEEPDPIPAAVPLREQPVGKYLIYLCPY